MRKRASGVVDPDGVGVQSALTFSLSRNWLCCVYGEHF